jgi:hypothetical protein
MKNQRLHTTCRTGIQNADEVTPPPVKPEHTMKNTNPSKVNPDTNAAKPMDIQHIDLNKLK